MSDDLQAQRDELVAKVQDIDYQLTARKTSLSAYHEECGRDWDAFKSRYFAAKHDYENWRRSALSARRHLLEELGEVKAALRDGQVQSDNRYRVLRQGIQRHRRQTLENDYSPTDADLALWALVDDDDSESEKGREG